MDATDKSILRFLLRSLMVISMGLVIPILWYVVADPFKVLRHYDNYFPGHKHTDVRIGMNKGMVTLTNFNDRRNEGQVYDAFIFGSSISCYYYANSWAAILKKAEKDSITDHRENEGMEINPYHFDSSSESLVSMSRKVCYLDREGVSIRHALIVLDPIIMGTETTEGPAYLDPPQLHESLLETVKYHYTFFRAATNADFFKSYIPSRIKDAPVENGRNLLFEVQPFVYDKIHNQETIPYWDSLIRKDSKSFYKEHPLKESPSYLSESRKVLTEERIQALERIKDVFERQASDYQIIIGPNRSKITLNSSDLKELQRIFSPGRIHDFSSALASILEEDTMLYDNTHYRPPMAEIMMRKVYQIEDADNGGAVRNLRQ